MPAFVYVIYIAASAETVWNALINREVTKDYWSHHNRSDWMPGSRWNHVRTDGSGTVDIVGRVVEIDRPVGSSPPGPHRKARTTRRRCRASSTNWHRPVPTRS